MWVDVPGYEYLQVTEDGRVRTLPHNVWTVQTKRSYWQHRSGKELSPSLIRGRYVISIKRTGGDGKSKQVPTQVSRLVCLAFHGLPTEEKPFALHRDDNPTHNHKNNLYWGSPAQNMADREANGHTPRGSKHPGTRLTDGEVAEIQKTYKAKSKDFGANALAKKYGVHRTTIENIVNGRTWSHVFC